MRLAAIPALLALTTCPADTGEKFAVQGRHDVGTVLAAEGEAENEAESEAWGERPSEPEAEMDPRNLCGGIPLGEEGWMASSTTGCPSGAQNIPGADDPDDPMSWSGFGSKFRRGNPGISVGDVPPEPRQTGSQSFIEGVDRTLRFVIEK